MGQQDDELANLVPTAEQALEKVTLAEAEKASVEMKRKGKADAEKQAIIDQLSKPSGRSDADVLKRVAVMIQRAVNEGRLQVEVYRFPNAMCTDRGRAINNQEKGWEDTLTGVPREAYEFWKRNLRDRGYKLICEIVEFPGGVPGDVGMSLKWG